MYDVVVKKFTFAVSSRDELLVFLYQGQFVVHFRVFGILLLVDMRLVVSQLPTKTVTYYVSSGMIIFSAFSLTHL